MLKSFFRPSQIKNKTEDPSVPYAGQVYVTKRKVSLIYYKVLIPLRNPKELYKELKGTVKNAKEPYRKSNGLSFEVYNSFLTQLA